MLTASSLVGAEKAVVAKSSLILDVKPVSVSWHGCIVVPLCMILIPPLYHACSVCDILLSLTLCDALLFLALCVIFSSSSLCVWYSPLPHSVCDILLFLALPHSVCDILLSFAHCVILWSLLFCAVGWWDRWVLEMRPYTSSVWLVYYICHD